MLLIYNSLKYLYNTNICNLTSKEAQVIVFQYNCTSKKPRGKEIEIFKKFPHADIYSSRKKAETPGTVEMLGSKNERLILAFFTQKKPGNPIGTETKEKREEWFKKCLENTSKIKNLKSIAFSYTKDNWKNYEKMITEFKSLRPEIEVIIIFKDSNPEITFDFLKWVWTQLEESKLIDKKYKC